MPRRKARKSLPQKAKGPQRVRNWRREGREAEVWARSARRAGVGQRGASARRRRAA